MRNNLLVAAGENPIVDQGLLSLLDKFPEV